MPKNTRLAGHGLIGEGRPLWRKQGAALCECGARSEPHISANAARRWISEHKEEVRVARGLKRLDSEEKR